MDKDVLDKFGPSDVVADDFSKRFSFVWSLKVQLGRILAKAIAWVIVLVIVLPIIIVASLGASTAVNSSTTEEIVVEEGKGGSRIVIINIIGDIASSSSDVSITENTTPELIRDELKTALKNESIKGIILKVSSGGGEAVASRLIYDEIIKAGASKPIYAYIEDIGASGAYMSALGAEKIYAYDEAWIGSIGVIMQMTNFTDLANKYGVKQYTYKTGELKDAGDPLRNPTDQDNQYFNYLLGKSFDDFKNMVKERRKLDDATLAKVTDGSVFVSEDALANKLIDAVGNQDAVIAAMRDKIGDKDAEVVEYRRRGSFGDLLSSKIANILIKLSNPPATSSKIMYK